MVRYLYVATCGARKIWDVNPNAPEYVEARKAYVGPLSKKTIEYCEKFYPDSYVILSAKYGFLLPYEKIKNYNAVCSKNPLITVSELKEQARTKYLNGVPLINYDKVVVLGSTCYCNWVKEVFGEDKVECPLAGLPIGKMLKKLNSLFEHKGKI
ncbi:DUF6884 domain-containing protein [Thermococcus alcaliphilus]|uniref:DUF6884 domain-containing protein n=1 Tax=Thermococcus alcaliphilus TaxID=139207 RepID=UPI0020908EC2|nr:DUF6884 domain-containing protein [Thermococcus alcaliphilus]MCO6041239.1 hypothetical protein [Thermococcus alcaliphilus]